MLAWLVLNEHSRRGRELADDVRACLRARGVEIIEGAFPAEVAPQLDCIIAAGGDGTIARLVPAAVAHGVPLGIIPLGTFNELARTLGIPFDAAGACEVIVGKHERAIDVGRVNKAYFVNEASIGVSSRIARMQTIEIKQRYGILGVIGTAVQAYRHARPIHAEVHYDGKVESLRTIQLTVANSNRFGGVFNVTDASIEDGWLDLFSVEIEHFAQAFGIVRAILAGRRDSISGLRTLRATSFDVRTRHAHRITADGESAGVTPATFSILPKALRVMVPS